MGKAFVCIEIIACNRSLSPFYAPAMGHNTHTHICPRVCVCVCVFQNRVRAITKPYIMGFENNLAQMIIMTRRCVANKNHVARSKVKVTVCT